MFYFFVLLANWFDFFTLIKRERTIHFKTFCDWPTISWSKELTTQNGQCYKCMNPCIKSGKVLSTYKFFSSCNFNFWIQLCNSFLCKRNSVHFVAKDLFRIKLKGTWWNKLCNLKTKKKYLMWFSPPQKTGEKRESAVQKEFLLQFCCNVF